MGVRCPLRKADSPEEEEGRIAEMVETVQAAELTLQSKSLHSEASLTQGKSAAKRVRSLPHQNNIENRIEDEVIDKTDQVSDIKMSVVREFFKKRYIPKQSRAVEEPPDLDAAICKEHAASRNHKFPRRVFQAHCQSLPCKRCASSQSPDNDLTPCWFETNEVRRFDPSMQFPQHEMTKLG